MRDLVDLDLDRVRDLLAGAAQHLLADQLGEQHLARLVGALLRRVHERALRDQLGEPLDAAARGPSPVRAQIGKTSSTPSSSAAAASTGDQSRAALEPVDLVDRADHRRLGARRRAAPWR